VVDRLVGGARFLDRARLQWVLTSSTRNTVIKRDSNYKNFGYNNSEELPGMAV
jgi:hypothetical protein